jgi:pyruvate/oxaloacetate carboxyltransferase
MSTCPNHDASDCIEAIRELTNAIEHAIEFKDLSGQEIYAKAMRKLVKRIIDLAQLEVKP